MRVEDELINPLKAFLQMRLNQQSILRFGEDVDQILIGQEKKARKLDPFLLQVLFQSLLYLANQLQTLLQVRKQTGNRLQTQHQRVVHNIPHHQVPIPLYFLKLHVLIGERLADILETENGLQIKIHLLDFDPHFEDILDIQHELFPADGPCLHELYIRVLSDRLRFNGVVLQLHLNVLNALSLQNLEIPVFPLDDDKL